MNVKKKVRNKNSLLTLAKPTADKLLLNVKLAYLTLKMCFKQVSSPSHWPPAPTN